MKNQGGENKAALLPASPPKMNSNLVLEEGVLAEAAAPPEAGDSPSQSRTCNSEPSADGNAESLTSEEQDKNEGVFPF